MNNGSTLQQLRGKKIGFALALPLLFASAVAVASDEVGMFLDLRVNQTERGEFATYRSTDGDFFIRLADFPDLGLKRDISLPRARIEGEIGSFVSLRELGAVNMALDATKMTLSFDLPPEVFEKTTIDVAARDDRYLLGSEHKSGFVNYRLTDTSYGASTVNHALATELGIRWGGWLFLNQGQWRETGGNSRYLTQLVYDRPEIQQRFVAGDFTALSSELGSVLPMGGLNLSKVYTMSPEIIRQPMAGFAGVANSPSQVEVRMGGVPVAYSQVGAGPFELQNLRQYGGSNDVQVVVRDALGREQVYSFPYYYSDQSLREGLQEYSYSLGKIRIRPGQVIGDDYDKPAFSAFHRIGYSDSLTLGARAEAAEDLNNTGLEVAWRSDLFGVVSGAISGSNYKGQAGEAAMLAYNYRQPKFALSAVARNYSDHYAPLETVVNGFNRRGESGVSLSWYPSIGQSLNVSHTLTQSRTQGDSRISSANYTQRLGASSYLYVTLQHTEDDFHSRPNTSLFIGWLYRFDGKYTASATALRDETGQQSLLTQIASDIPYGEGVGYRIGWIGTEPPPTDRFSGYAQWNLPAVSLSVDANTLPAFRGNADYREFAVAGSIAYAGNAWGFTRQITDSFAIARMNAPVAGVRVLANNQEIGVTNEKGQVISPFLGSFYESQISVDDQTIPLQYVLAKNNYTIKPAYRSGSDVNFGLRRMHGVEGVIRLRTNTGTSTADNQIVTLTRNSELEQEFQVGSGGHFYLENIAAGDYKGMIKSAEHACSFALTVPDTQEIVFTLQGDLVCEPNP